MVDNKDINPNDWSESKKSEFEKWRKKEEERKLLRETCKTLTETKLFNALQEELTDYCWHLEHHPKGMDGAQRVDVIGEPKSGQRLVFIEIERGVGRPHAIANVVKAWRYIEERTDSKPILLLQIFSPYFYEKPGNKRRMKEAIFIGKQAEKATSGKLRYKSLGRDFWPPTKAAKLDRLVEEISRLIAD